MVKVEQTRCRNQQSGAAQQTENDPEVNPHMNINEYKTEVALQSLEKTW